MKFRFGVAVGLATAAIVPVVVNAPEPALNLPDDVRTLDEAVAECEQTGLAGWELVDFATRLVNAKFTRHSLWHLWESPARAFAMSRGFSIHYNAGLAEVLEALGFDVELVHCRTVRFDKLRHAYPRWARGHTWLRVTIDGETRDVCASRADNVAGRVRFIPESAVTPADPWTLLLVRAKLALPVGFEVWRSFVGRRPVARWLFRGFHDQG